MTTEFVWLRNPDTGGVQKFAKRAAAAWQEAGWQPCDPPTPPNLALTTRRERARHEAPEQTETEPANRPAEKPTTKNRRPSGANPEE